MSLLQNIVSFIGLFCNKDLYFFVICVHLHLYLMSITQCKMQIIATHIELRSSLCDRDDRDSASCSSSQQCTMQGTCVVRAFWSYRISVHDLPTHNCNTLEYSAMYCNTTHNETQIVILSIAHDFPTDQPTTDW